MLLTKYQNLSELEDIWNKVWSGMPEAVPFNAYSWVSTWTEIFHEGKPFIYGFFDDKKNPVGFAAFKIIADSIYWLAGEEVTDYQDLVCRDIYNEGFWTEIIKSLSANDGKKLILRNIPEDSLSRKSLKKISNAKNIKYREAVEDIVPQILLPKTYDEYLNLLSRKHRHEIRRKFRKFENEVGSSWQIKKTTGETHDSDCHKFFVLFRQNGEAKREFLTPPMEEFFCQITTKMQKLSLLDMSSLVIDNIVVAQTISFINKNNLYLYNIAVNPEYYPLSPGIIINKLLIEESIANGRIIYDFMQGNERYKYELGGKDKYVYKITLF